MSEEQDLVSATLKEYEILIGVKREFFDTSPPAFYEIFNAFICDYKNNEKWQNVRTIKISIID